MPTAGSSRIVLREVTYTYPGRRAPALDSVSYRFEAGKLYALLGRNGSGKSTLARCLNALLVPDSGTVEVGGISIASESDRRAVCRIVSMVFQNPDTQMIGPTVEEEVAFGPENLGLPTDSIRSRVDEAFEGAGIAGLVRRQPLRLSHGQKQQVAIAGAMAMEPEFLVSDESTSMLDYSSRGRVLGLFGELRERGIGIIHATHFMEEAAAADEVLVLDRGRVAVSGPPRAVLGDAAAVRALGLDPLIATRVVEELRARGHAPPEEILTVEELVSWLRS
ncbi:MAG: ATP-binding cassette domain-containing protein [Actinomycetota bacterium]